MAALPAIAAVLLAAGALMSVYTEAWQFWVSALVIGAGMAFTTGVAMSAVIDQWFVKKAGLAIGLALGGQLRVHARDEPGDDQASSRQWVGVRDT